jgi:hypothetical protein
MPGHELRAPCGHLVGDRDGLFRIAGIVADGKVELLAKHAAGFIDVCDGHFAAILHLGAEGGILPGDWANHRDRGGVVIAAATS